MWTDLLRRSRLALLISLSCFGLIWFVSPWLYLRGLEVQSVRLLQASNAKAPQSLKTAEWLRITFSTPQDIAAFRARWGLAFIQAEIASCHDHGGGSFNQTVAQGQGYLPDAGRVRLLEAHDTASGRFIYQADFDNVLVTHDGTGEGKLIPATTAAGGLCFRLHGATIASGSVRSATVPLKMAGR